MAVFHLMCSVSLHVSATLFVSACPSPAGPRNCGQFDAPPEIANASAPRQPSTAGSEARRADGRTIRPSTPVRRIPPLVPVPFMPPAGVLAGALREADVAPLRDTASYAAAPGDPSMMECPPTFQSR